MPVTQLAYVDANTGYVEPVNGTSGTMDVKDRSIRPGDDSTFDRHWGGAKCLASAICTADTLIASGACVLYGYTVHVATATASTTIEDGITAGTGATKITIPASKAIGEYALPVAILCPTGIFLNFAPTATGSISVLYLPVAS